MVSAGALVTALSVLCPYTVEVRRFVFYSLQGQTSATYQLDLSVGRVVFVDPVCWDRRTLHLPSG